MRTDTYWIPKARILMNDRLIAINSFSGSLLSIVDLEVPEYFLNSDVADSVLGSSALAALENSRSFSLEASRELDQKVEATYHEWVERAMKYGRYKTRHALFRQMENCSIKRKHGKLIITPLQHRTQETWRELYQPGGTIWNLSIPEESAPEEIGAAIRTAVARVERKKRDSNATNQRGGLVGLFQSLKRALLRKLV